VPVGLSTQSVPDIKEMTARLLIPYDIVSDEHLSFVNQLRLPTFKVENKVYIKRLTLIVEKSIIKHFFYPVFPPDLHVKEVIQWLDSNR
jgi:peroxiredoxin